MTFPDSYPGSHPTSSTTKGSRFSSFKVFGKILKEKDTLKPPAPPPKDTYYLNNRSLVSLQYPQDSSSSPQTPYSSSPYSASNPHPIGSAYGTMPTNSNMDARSQYAPSVHSKRPPINAASSSFSVASSSSLVSSPSEPVPSPSNQIPPPSAKSKKSGFFAFSRKGTKSPGSSRSGTVDETMSLHSNGEDGNISTPWNFQHNIHVDDALGGLPPSWTVSLSKAGFTEEEIVAIYARKQAGTLTPAGDLPPQVLGGYERPRSPAISIASSAASARTGTAASSAGSFGSNVAPSPILAHPLPRSTSLPRNQSNEDARQTIVGPPAPSRLYSPAPSVSSQRPGHSNMNLSVSISASATSRMKPHAVAVQGDEEAIGATVLPDHHRRTTSTSSRGPSRAPSLKNRKESPKIQPPPFNSTSPSSQTSPVSRPSTPPRRAYFVANSQTPSFTSPPPSYSSANGTHPNLPYPSDKVGGRHYPQPSTDSSRSGHSSSSQSPSRRSPSRAISPKGHQYSNSSASHNTYSSASSGEVELRRSMSAKSIKTPTSLAKENKRRSKRNFEGLNISLDLGLDSWGDSLMKAIPSASPTQLAFDRKRDDTTTGTSRSRTQSNASTSSFLGQDEVNRNTNRDTIRPPASQPPKTSIMDRPRPKPPAPSLDLPPRVNIIADDSPLSSSSPYTSSFSPSPSVTTFQGGLATSPLRNMSFTQGEGGAQHDEFPVSPGFMSDYAASVASVSPRTGLFDEIAGMVGIKLDEEDAARLSPVTATGKTGKGRGGGRGASPALTEANSPIIPVSPAGRGTDSRTSAYRIQDREKLKSSWDDEEEDEDRWSREHGSGEGEEDGSLLTARRNDPNRNSSRSSTSTVSTLTVTTATATATNVKAAVAKIAPIPVTLAKSHTTLEPNGKSFSNVIPASRRMELAGARLGARPYHPPSVAPPSLPPPPPAVVEPPISRSKSPVASLKHPASPQDSIFGSEEGSGLSSSDASASSRFSGSSVSQLSPTTETDNEDDDELVYYLETHGGSQYHPQHNMLTSTSDTFGGVSKEDEDALNITLMPDDDDDDEDDVLSNNDTISHINPPSVTMPPKPTIIITNQPKTPGPITAAVNATPTPITPAQRYPGWLSAVVKPLEEFIDEQIEPRDYYKDLQEIAEGESGSVFAAHLTETGNIHKLKLPPLIKAQDADNQIRGITTLVAIKCVQILPSGSTKLDDLRREMVLLRGMSHLNVLSLDALYVDLVDDSLWLRMELMERSLADVVELVGYGLVLQERTIARFTSDVLEALQYLRSHNIAHRDVRSDNLLLNTQGVLKLTDFSNAIKLPKETSMAFEPVGVLYWQAPEVRAGPYNALKIDVWSLGATVWEMAQARPPFTDAEEDAPSKRWPPLDQPQLYSPAFHDFLRLCSEPPETRPDASSLLKNSFVKNSCGRQVVVQVLQQCMSIEQAQAEDGEDGEDEDS